MNAHEYVAKHGVEGTKECLPSYIKHYCGLERIFIDELKQVVESVEIVDRWKGLKNCKDIIAEATSTQLPPEKSFAARMIIAIADYELVESFKKSTLVEYLDECEQVVNSWPKWKKESMQNAFGFGGKNEKCEILDMVDVSPRCEVRNG